MQLATGTDDLRADASGGVLTLTLNRPAARNAFSAAMLDALAAALARAEDDDEVRVVVLTGAGPAFCAGGDVKTMARGESIFGPMHDPGLRTARQIAAQRGTVVRLRDYRKPTIALLNGPAVGAGLGLALACDLRYAAASAVLRTGFTAVGLAGDFGCTWSLHRLVGPSRAAELLYFAEPLPADRALALGLVNGVLPDGELLAAGLDRARRLAARSTLALRAVKENLRRAATEDLPACADAEARWHVRLLDSDGHRDAVRAALRK